MSTPPRYGTQTWIGAAVILMGLGFAGVQILAPPASTANSTQPVAARPTPRIIEINTKREDYKPAEPARPVEQATAPGASPMTPPAPQFAEPATPPVSAAELKRKAQEEADQTAELPQEAVNPPPKRERSRGRYPKYDRHAVY